MNYHWEGLDNRKFIESLSIFDYYNIYFHWWYIRLALNKWNKASFNLCEFKDFTIEQACNHYWKFKKEINIK